MSNQLIPYNEVEKMSIAVSKSGLFGVKTADQALALMLIAQAEGLHPAVAARDYDIIQGKPTLKAKAKLSRFQKSGGVFKWIERTDEKCSAEFSHPTCPVPIIVTWDRERAKKAELMGKAMYKKFPCQMFSARVISEGVDATYPDAGGGMYTPEEQQDIISDEVIPKAKERTSSKLRESVKPKEEIKDAEIVEPKPKPEAQPEPDQTGVECIISNLSEQEVKKAGKPATKYSTTVGDVGYITFDKKIAFKINEAKMDKKKIVLMFDEKEKKSGGKYNEITDIIFKEAFGVASEKSPI